jgi:hypothetical protein
MYSDKCIINIPHCHFAFSYINEIRNNLNTKLLRKNDWAIETIFRPIGIDRVVAPFSKLDIEKNIHNDVRQYFCNNELENYVKTNYYNKYNDQFISLINSKLDKYDEVTIVDCYSFSVGSNLDLKCNEKENEPNILWSYNYDEWSYEIKNKFDCFNSNEISNFPYLNTSLPQIINNDKRVNNISIGINESLYTQNGRFDISEIIKLNSLVHNFFYGNLNRLGHH